MSLSPGNKLGSYEIVGPIGKGGMGEVYRGHDAKLNRDVAIKVLPEALAHDADYLARFQREAQILAALNHPNIATIFGLEQNAIIMELVDGETLRTPLPFDEAMAVAKQIAEALEAAHDKGIIHRDLKPGNIKVTPEGVVKVLDFGLAKGVERSTAAGPDSPTLTMRATEAGLILGTASYMSPEQAAGKPVDRRADIWSFGVVLYELVTGKRLFDGETIAHTLADVIRAPINLEPVPEGPIRDLVRRCLDRNVKDRLSHIGEARYIIDHLADHPAVPKPAAASRLPWAAAAVCGLAALAGWGLWLRKPAEARTAFAFEINPPEGLDFADIGPTAGSAISPDGTTLAFVAINEKREMHLFVRAIHSLEARVLPGTLGAGRPFWSPDSKSLGFVADDKLKRIDVAAGPPITLCDALSPRGGTWNKDGVIVFGQRSKGLHRIAASGGTPTEVTALGTDSDASSHYYPQFLPDGKHFLFLIINRLEADKSGIFVGSLDGQAPVRVVQTRFSARYDTGSGQLLYLQGSSTLIARRFDPNSLTFSGDPAVIAEGVASVGGNGYSDFSLSNAGDLFYGRGREQQLRLVWRDRGGKLLSVAGGQPGLYGRVRLSPDGTKAAYLVDSGTNADFWVLDLERQLSTRVTFIDARDGSICWSKDGKHLYYSKYAEIHRKAADGSGADELLWKADGGVTMISELELSPDGSALLFHRERSWLLPLTGERKPVAFGSEGINVLSYRFSMDGRWLAYYSIVSGRDEIFVRGYPEERGKWQVSANSVTPPSWRADGKEMYWKDAQANGAVRAVSLELQQTGVRIGKPESLFQVEGYLAGPSVDGRRFLMAEPATAAAAKIPMLVVRNWAEKLKS